MNQAITAIEQDIILTPNAAKRVAAIAEKQGKPAILRLAVEGGGCSGFQYGLNIEDAPETRRTRPSSASTGT